MKTYIALMRGINVGGKNILPMKELASILEKIGSRNIKTYIQSGNAVFRSEEPDAVMLADRIRCAVRKRRGFEPRVYVMEPEEMERAMEANPFPEAESEPKSLHLFFLASNPKDPNLDALESVKSETERFVLGEGVFYLHAPDGVGRSKLSANVEKILGVPTTARNWRTVLKVSEMAKKKAAG